MDDMTRGAYEENVLSRLEAIASNQRRAANADWQVKYMCEEIGKALGTGTQSPADTVESVRQFKAYMDRRDAKREDEAWEQFKAACQDGEIRKQAPYAGRYKANDGPG